MDFRQRRIVAILLGGGFILSSCQLSIPIEIQQLDNGKISIEAKDNFGKPCIGTIQIVDSYAPNAKVFWEIAENVDLAPSTPCTTKITYPDKPYGYDLSSPAKDLVPGQKYYVLVHGGGYSSSAEFVRRKLK